MQKRKWDSKQKLQVVLEGLKGRTVASICNEYQISQSVYYRWRDAFFANADKVFEANKIDKTELRLLEENKKLKQAVGELTLEFKKKRLVKLSRKASVRQVAKDTELIIEIEKLKAEHPFWGYRRVWAWLKFKMGISINQKRVYRLMKLHNLLAKQNLHKAKRTPNKSKPIPTCVNEWWGIDMTKILTHSGWVYFVLVIDWFTKEIVGYELDYQSKTSHWQKALDMAINEYFPDGVRDRNLNLMSDNGTQPTSISFMKECSNLGINQAFTSYNNPKGNADTERMMRTIKEELLWLNEWCGLEDMKPTITNCIHWYNNEYLHSSLVYISPNTMRIIGAKKNQQSKQNSPLIAA